MSDAQQAGSTGGSNTIGTSSAVAVIADMIRAHQIERRSVSSPDESHQWGRCTGCDFESPSVPIRGVNWEQLAGEIATEHQAEMVDAALGGLSREVIHYSGYEAASGSGCEISTYTKKRTVYRWFSKWTAEGWTPEERSEK